MKKMELEERAKEEQKIIGIKRNQQEMGKIYYITEASNAVKVENHVLRYWEEELGLPVRRNEQGHRYYTEEDIRLLRKIKRLKDQGLQLKAIKLVLKGMNYLPVEEEDIKNKGVVAVEEKDAQNKDTVAVEEKEVRNNGAAVEEEDIKNNGAAAIEEENVRNQGTYDAKKTKKNSFEKKTFEADYLDDNGMKEADDNESDDNMDMNAPDCQKEFYDSAQIMQDSKKERSDGLMEKDNMETGRGGLDKLQKLRLIIKLIVRETMDEYISDYRKEIQDVIAKEMDYQFRMWQEQQEEMYSGYDRKHKMK